MTKEEYKDAIEVSVIFHEGQKMFAVPKQPAQQEPVAILFGTLPVYDTSPAQRTWVGLTDEEIARVVSLAGFAPDWVEAHIATQIVRVLETKLKEKNT